MIHKTLLKYSDVRHSVRCGGYLDLAAVHANDRPSTMLDIASVMVTSRVRTSGSDARTSAGPHGSRSTLRCAENRKTDGRGVFRHLRAFAVGRRAAVAGR